MKAEQNSLSLALRQVLAPTGWQFAKGTWRHDLPELIWIIALQKSQYGQQFYLCLGVWVKQLGDLAQPREWQCHLRTRATTIAPEQQPSIEREILDLEYTAISETDRQARLAELLTSVVLPFLGRLHSLDDLRMMAASGAFTPMFVAAPLSRLLASPSDCSDSITRR